jgi:hypothetical protein
MKVLSAFAGISAGLALASTALAAAPFTPAIVFFLVLARHSSSFWQQPLLGC